jgi:hypothetical protein
MSTGIEIAGKGLMVIAGLMLAGAFIDNALFADNGQIVFILMTTMWMWIDFQTSRLDHRLTRLTPEDISAITESSDVVMAKLKSRQIKMNAAVIHYEAVKEQIIKDKRLIVH